MNSIPSKALTLSGPSDLSVGSDSPEIPGPYNDISLDEPHMKQAVTPTSVPLSGFLNLSAVS